MTDIFLRSGETSPNDIRLRNPLGVASATLASTLDALTLSATATLKLQAALASTLNDLTLSAAATLKLQAALAATLDDVTLVSESTLTGGTTAAVGFAGKKKKRWYTFENGLRVHASDPITARRIANWRPDQPEPIAEPRKPTPERRKRVAATVAAPDDRDARARLARAEMRAAEKAFAEAKEKAIAERAALARAIEAAIDEEEAMAIFLMLTA